MKSYSQNSEDLTIYNYLNGQIKSVLEIGANSPHHFSNSRMFIKLGATAYLVEPSTVCEELQNLYANNSNVNIYNYGIGERDEVVPFYESGAHVMYGNDRALVSSTDFEETVRWRNSGVEFNERNIQLVSWDNFWNETGNAKFDLISIDVEGMELPILQQINLNVVACKAIIIEWNGVFERKVAFENYILPFGFKLINLNNENLLFVRI